MHTQWKRWSRNGLWLTLTVTFNNFLYEKKCGLIIFFLLKILAKQFILKNNETVENLHKMYIDWGLFFQWIHLPITTQHINHLCVSDAFFKGTFHKYKPTNKFFWTCIVKLTTIRHLTWQAHSVRIISMWTQYHGQLYWLFCTKNPQRIKIWKHPNQFSNLAEYRKENLFFSVKMTKCYIFETIILFLSQIQRKKVLVLKYGFQQHYVTQC